MQARDAAQGRKRRPVYVLGSDGQAVTFLAITSQYANKSAFIRQFYCPITDWAEANLDRPSWINTYEVYQASLREIVVDLIGYLSESDTDRLFHLLSEHDALLRNNPDNSDDAPGEVDGAGRPHFTWASVGDV